MHIQIGIKRKDSLSGKETGALQMLFDLVKKNLLTSAEAAEQVNIEPSVFQEKYDLYLEYGKIDLTGIKGYSKKATSTYEMKEEKTPIAQRQPKNKKMFFGEVSVVVLSVLTVILLLNFKTSWISDDYMYHFFFNSGQPWDAQKMMPWDVFLSMKNHWKIWNGRVVAHGLLQIAMMTGETGFRLINAFMYILLGALIYLHAAYGKQHSASLLALIYVCMWFFLPQFGLTVLWASGTANYLWMANLILAYLLVYRVYLAKPEKIRNTWENAVWFGILGVFAGCTNENTGCVAAFLGMLFVGIYFMKHITVPKWAVTGIVGLISGWLFLIQSPSNKGRISTDGGLELFFARLHDIYNITMRNLSWLFILTGIAAIIYIIRKKGKIREMEGGMMAVVYFLAGISSIAVLVFSNALYDRAWFFAAVLFILALSVFYDELLEKTEMIYGVLTVGMGLVFLLSFRMEYQKISTTYAQVKEGLDRIENTVREGEPFVHIPMVTPSDSKYDAYNGTSYVDESVDGWFNGWMAKYYGLDAIYGYSK